MKKIIALILVCISVLAFAACQKQQGTTEEVPKTLDEEIPNAYVGDTAIEDKVTLGGLEIVIKEKTFYINDIKFAFKDFDETDKLSMSFEGGMLDVYVTDGKLQKCVTYSADYSVETEYNIEGKGVSQTKKTIDDYGNAVLVCFYGEDGKLQSFYEADYNDKCDITEKREFNATYDLVDVIKYEYDGGKCVREIVYDADLKLVNIKENEE